MLIYIWPAQNALNESAFGSFQLIWIYLFIMTCSTHFILYTINYHNHIWNFFVFDIFDMSTRIWHFYDKIIEIACRRTKMVFFLIHQPGFWFSVKSQCSFVSDQLDFSKFPRTPVPRISTGPRHFFKDGRQTPDWCMS